MKNVFKIVLIVGILTLFGGCGLDSENDGDNNIETKAYILHQDENATLSVESSFLAQSEDTKVKITRDIEKEEIMNIYVLKGSVEVTEVIIQ